MIKPVNIPSGAGLDYGSGDVRHYSEGDAVDIPGLANPTRYLAKRDELLATSLNEVIETVNNNEQPVSLIIPRTTVPKNTEEVITNWRIPPGFEARVLNASIAGSPVSSDVELNVYFATGFGNTTGTAIVTTSSESEPQTSFKNNGELVVSLKNKGSISLEIMASVLLTMRPLGGQGGILVGTTVVGEQGPPGNQGPRGEQGLPGTGGAGSPGIVWQGIWASTHNYSSKDAVSFTSYGTLTSSYIARIAHLSDVSNQPPNVTYWDVLASGAAGPAGTTGSTGSAGADGDIPFTMVASQTTVSGTFTSGATFLAGNYSNDYTALGLAPSSTQYVSLTEAFIGSNAGTPLGVTMLNGVIRTAFAGYGTITLPKQAYGAKLDYNNTQVSASVAANGTVPTETQGGVLMTRTIQVSRVSSDKFVVAVLNPTPLPVSITLSGVQLVS